MTRRLLIIGGGILGMMSASAAAKAGGFSEIIVTEQALGPSGASHYSGGVHVPYGCQDRTRSLTRKSAVVLAAVRWVGGQRMVPAFSDACRGWTG
ncbi:hypothetical protein X772_29920 [Mesorhizobium sp. LSJC280B00]|nr:hypothetical protein X772_29920 [Mesorhizobium sp. LSJC280B00]